MGRDSVRAILQRHGFVADADRIEAAASATHPTFVCGDVVVKLFGEQRPFSCERAAYRALATEPGMAVPELLGDGRLRDRSGRDWSYLVITRLAGTNWNADLTDVQRRAVAVDLGRFLKRVHTLQPPVPVSDSDWMPTDILPSLEHSSLPSHLVRQAPSYVRRVAPRGSTFVHGDIVAKHVFLAEGRLSGVIDWGDAIVTDPHYELVQPFRDMFDCDKSLLGAMLDACDWLVLADFADRALACALLRQAIGCVQHRSMDVFEPIAERLPLLEFATLDELAGELFGL